MAPEMAPFFAGILARGKNGAIQAGFDWLVNVEIVKPNPSHMAVKAQFVTNWGVSTLGAVHAFTRRTANTDYCLLYTSDAADEL